MATDSSISSEEGSQQTRQTQTTKKSKGKWPSKSDNEKLKGDIAELGGNVYAYGTRNQGDLYVKTTEAIAAYVGKKYDKSMWDLVKNGNEYQSREPEEPKGRDVSPYKMKKYEKELARHFDKVD